MAGQEITVYKLNLDGAVLIQYWATVIEQTPEGVVLAARWTMPRRDLGYAVFETGDCFLEFFYRTRWYNIFRISSEQGVLRGWYCNITRPAEITDIAVRAVDLALDLWVWPDRRMQVLDEDEFAVLLLAEDERAAARQALEELRQQVQQGSGPFRAML